MAFSMYSTEMNVLKEYTHDVKIARKKQQQEIGC